MDIPPPPSFTQDSGDTTGQNWNSWKQAFKIYLSARDLDNAAGKRKVSLLLHFLGHDGVKLYNTFVFRAAIVADADNNIAAVAGEDRNNLETVLNKYDEHYGRGKMRNLKRQAFLKCHQKPGESAMDFIANLRHKAQMCEYGGAEESILCDRIIDGVIDERTKVELLNLEDNLNLENCIRICRRDELTALQLNSKGAEGGVHAFTRGRGHQRNYSGQLREHADSRNISCDYCCRRHPPRQCPAFSKYCGTCGKKGHFARSSKCQRRDQTRPDVQQPQYGGRQRHSEQQPSRRGQRPSRQYRGRGGRASHRTVHNVDNNFDQLNENFDACEIVNVLSCDQYEMSCNNSEGNESWYVELTVDQKPLVLKIDTGAVVSVVSGKTITQMGLGKQVKPSTMILNGINSSRQSDGVISLLCSYKTKQVWVEYQVLNHDKCVNLLSKADSLKFGLIARVDQVVSDPNQIILKYNDVFDGTIGCIPGTYHIKLDSSVQSVVVPPRSVPAPIRMQVKSELDQLERSGIIAKVQGPTDWVSPMVCVHKASGRIRLCIDPFHLNRAILREHYPMSSIDDILTRLSGSKYFSVLDANMGFYQIKLTDESSRLTTFSTPFGRYRHLRLPMGISSAPEIYQRAMSDIFSDIEGVEIVMDDILIHGTSRAEHDSRLEAVLRRSREVNLKMNPKKTQVALQEVKYVGHKLTRDGVKPDEDRIKSIVNMKDPENISELETILGMISYVSKFIPNLSDLNSPLRELKTRDEWSWGAHEHSAFQQVKDALVSTKVLRYYDVRKPVTVTVDASRKGLGAAVLQDGGVIAYASRALTPTEQRYAQIELEMLAIVFGCQRFHKMIYGKRDVIVESDHKPLENLHMKPIHSAPMRIQRMMLKLQPYTYTVRYVKGPQIGLADCLSRLPQPVDPEMVAESEESFMVCHIATLSDSNHEKIATATANDSELQAVRKLIIDGWPEQRQALPPATVQYWDFREQMGIYNGIVFRGSRICIPKQLRREMLNTLHSSHMGMVCTKQRAREVIFWPGMNGHIEEIIRRCPTCLEHRNRMPREPLKSHPIPELPWDHVSSDLFQLNGKNYLVMVDAYSGYIEVEALHDTSSITVIKTIKANIARYGIMSKLTTDNGPQFTSFEFKQFVLKYRIQHITSSPEYAQSNGLAERAVQTTKRLIKKAQQDGQDVYLALLELRNMPRDQVLGSPVQRLMGRRTKTLLPTSRSMLKPTSIPPETVYEKLQEYRDVQKKYYDRGKKPQPAIIPGDAVRLYTKTGWKPAEYIQAHESPRSHIVKSGDYSNEYRRNRNRLIITTEKPHVIIPTMPARSIPPPVSSSPRRISQQPHVEPLPKPPEVVKQPSTTLPQQPVTKSGRRIQRPGHLRDFVV